MLYWTEGSQHAAVTGASQLALAGVIGQARLCFNELQ